MVEYLMVVYQTHALALVGNLLVLLLLDVGDVVA
jgi:hypothetical protein